MAGVILEPLTIEEQATLAIVLLNCFGPRAAAARADPSRPASLADAWDTLRRDHPALAQKVPVFLLAEFARRLERAGLLEPAGVRGPSVPLDTCYWFMAPLTRLQKTGTAWLTAALGWSHLFRVASPRLCMVEVSVSGKRACGSGLLLAGGAIVTNRHVLEDGKLEKIWVGDVEVEFDHPLWSVQFDVGVVRTSLAAQVGGLAFRDHTAVEPVMMMGYPTIPLASDTPLTAQTGETCGPPVGSHHAGPQLLVSAVARPGNSGGPVFGQDGRIVGLVARSLHRDDGDPGVPFFAAIPAANVRAAVEEIDPTIAFPWETWEQ